MCLFTTKMTKRRAITSIEKLAPEMRQKLQELYPEGWSNHIRRINKPNGDFFHGITLETDDAVYLVKIPVKVDSKSDLEKEEHRMEKVDSGDARANESADSGNYEEPSENPDKD
jgi:hypothetical protein